jgi:hypothetical protein
MMVGPLQKVKGVVLGGKLKKAGEHRSPAEKQGKLIPGTSSRTKGTFSGLEIRVSEYQEIRV